MIYADYLQFFANFSIKQHEVRLFVNRLPSFFCSTQHLQEDFRTLLDFRISGFQDVRQAVSRSLHSIFPQLFIT